MPRADKRVDPPQGLAHRGAPRRLLPVALAVCLALVAVLQAACAGKAAAPGGTAAAARGNSAPAIANAAPSRAATPYDWLQFDGDPQHSGNNTQESAISGANVAGLTPLFRVSLPSVADGAPVDLSGVGTASGTRDLLFVTTKAGDIVALDAHDGSQVWIEHNPAGTCLVNNRSQPCYTTSSPVVDPNRQFVYSYGLDGRVHKYQVADGTEVTDGGWPQVATLKGFDEKGSSALAFAAAKNGAAFLYVANSGYIGDRGDYQGHVTAVNLSDGSQRVFNATCSDQTVHFGTAPGAPDCSEVQTAIWPRPGMVYDPDTDRVYTTTGNGTFSPDQHAWGDSVLALNPDGTGANGGPLDSYTPANFQQMDERDVDLGSTAPAILAAPPNSAVQHLAVQGGKDAMLRLLNLDDLSGQGGPGNTGGEIGRPLPVPQGGQVLTTPAVWVNPSDNSCWVFVANSSGISALQLTVGLSGTPSLQVKWAKGPGGTSPLVANGVLYYAGSGAIQALNPVDGTKLWSDGGIGPIHWESPVVVNGVLYITDESSRITAYALPQ